MRFCAILLAALIGLSSFQAAEAKTTRPKPTQKVKKHALNYHGKKPKKYKASTKFRAPKMKKPKAKRTTTRQI